MQSCYYFVDASEKVSDLEDKVNDLEEDLTEARRERDDLEIKNKVGSSQRYF